VIAIPVQCSCLTTTAFQRFREAVCFSDKGLLRTIDLKFNANLFFSYFLNRDFIYPRNVWAEITLLPSIYAIESSDTHYFCSIKFKSFPETALLQSSTITTKNLLSLVIKPCFEVIYYSWLSFHLFYVCYFHCPYESILFDEPISYIDRSDAHCYSVLPQYSLAEFPFNW
jgi:hypothetical protein